MAGSSPKYTIDSNVYIGASRDAAMRDALAAFSERHVPRLHLTSIVAQELLAGVRPTEVRSLERVLLVPFETRGRVFAPTYRDWCRAGELMSAYSARYGVPIAHMPRSLANDIHLAVTCRAQGLRLITANAQDFARIRTLLPGFVFDEPFPA